MSEKKSFLNWVGFSGEETATPGSVDRIRELEQQLADLRSRRDITSLSKEEFEILATETAMSMHHALLKMHLNLLKIKQRQFSLVQNHADANIFRLQNLKLKR